MLVSTLAQTITNSTAPDIVIAACMFAVTASVGHMPRSCL
jgi:hypothetical protein